MDILGFILSVIGQSDEGWVDGKHKDQVDRCRRLLLIRCGGEVIRGQFLASLLGYSRRSYNRALRDGTFQGPRLRKIPRGKGWYSTAQDLANWLVESVEDWEARIQALEGRNKPEIQRRRRMT